MDVITSIINAIGNVPAEAWASIFAIVGVSAFQQKLKHWLEIENPKVLVFMTSVFALAGAAIPAMLGFISANPGTMAGDAALWFTGLTLAYRYVVQPGSVALENWKGDVAKYKTYKANQEAAALPVADATTAELDDILDNKPAPAEIETPAPVPAGVATEFDG